MPMINPPSRETMVVIQSFLDFIGAFGCVYIAQLITFSYGVKTVRDRMQLIHRVVLIMGSVSFAYHAYDILEHPDAHGLTFTNVFLHMVLITSVTVSAIRIRMAQRAARDLGCTYKNGDALIGPVGS